MHRLLSQDYRQVLPARVQVRLLHRYRRTHLMILRRVQQQHEVTIQVFQHRETGRENLQKTKNTNKNGDIIPASGNRLRDLPEWLEEFTENLEDKEVPASRDTPANTSQDSDTELPSTVLSTKNCTYTHFPKDRNCEICKRTKIPRAPCRKRTDAVPPAENFEDMKTADQKVASEGCESRNSHRYAVVVQDLAIQSYPCETKTSQETERSLRKFLEPSEKRKVLDTDNSLEFCISCEELSWNHFTSTLHRSETNGITERAVRRIKEGTSALLLQSGLDEKWSADYKECYCYLRNVQDLLADGKTAYERLSGEPF